ncbi:hypothetical protein MNBD_GAMMA03-1911 [hydrothermal vent metagenome]|uniref:Beta-ketoacyl synthase N-terminal domain-containing protein n=1 Tax=hydrothermal vent metagenome TaxID=652676 RepID=A0A3B0X0Y1_9ZZZZ
MKIFRISQYKHAITSESEGQLPLLKEAVKERLGRNIRRIDRFTQLSLMGASDCRGDLSFPINTGIVMASYFGSLNNTFNVLSSMFQCSSRPSPYEFIHTVSNAASYYLARELELTSHNLFISQQHAALQACLKLAEIDLDCLNVNAVLIGQVSEVATPFDVYRERVNIKLPHVLHESSNWFLLANELKNEKSVASIVLNIEGTDAQVLSVQIKNALNEMSKKQNVIARLDEAFCSSKNDLVDCINVNQPWVNSLESSSEALFDFLQSDEFNVLLMVERVNRYKWSALVISKLELD